MMAVEWKDTDSKKKRTPKQIAAICCVALLVAMYLGTFLVACLDFPNWERLFWGCVAATVGLPILLWIYIWIYTKVRRDKEI